MFDPLSVKCGDDSAIENINSQELFMNFKFRVNLVSVFVVEHLDILAILRFDTCFFRRNLIANCLFFEPHKGFLTGETTSVDIRSS